MPHLAIKGCTLEQAKSIQNDLIMNLSELLHIPQDHFTFEYLQTTFLSEEVYPFVTVQWFDRGQEIKQQVANTITDYIATLFNGDITVYFEDLIKENYFENKKHF